MPDNKVSEAQKLYVNEIRSVKKTAEKWKAFLDFSAQLKISDNQSQYEFATKMIIHAHNPNATDCRLFGEWKTQDGNHVNFRERGIPVLTRDNNGKQSVAYVFDTNQTALNPKPELPEIADTSRKKIWSSIISEVSNLAENSSFSEEQKRLFKETAEYKLCKQYGLDTDENTERFSGIEKLSEKEIANIGIALNKCSLIVAEIVNSERSKANEQNNSKSGEDRSKLYGRESRGMDLGGGVQGTRQEVRVRRETEPVVQTEQGERNLRTADRNASTEADSGNGQVRQYETEIHMADPVPVGNNTERRYSETLRGDERTSTEPDRQLRGEEKEVGGIQENGKFGEISSDGAAVGEIPNGSGGRNTSRDSLRNITDINETAEPEKVSAVSACYERLKEIVLADERIINAVQNSDLDNLDIEIAKILNETAIKIFNDDIYGHIDFYADYFNAEKSEQHISTEKEIYDLLHSQYEKQNEQADRTEPESKTIRTADDIEIGDKYHYKGRDYTVVSMQGVYPDDVGISYEEKLANGTTYAITENVSKYKLESDGVYLGKEIEPDNEISEPESVKRTIPNTIEHRNFAKLEKLFPEIMSKEHIYERHESKELEPLSLEWLDGDYLSVMHTYTLNGDLMRDPDIVLKVDFENETVSAISYENSGLGQYMEYEDGSPGQRDTNRFMSDWLKNIEQQEYALSRAMVDYPFENDVYDIKINYKNGNIISVDGDDRAAEDFIKKNKIEIQKDESEITTPEEPDILGTYAIYQLKDGDDTRDYRFISSSEMEKQGLSINKNNYDLVYSGELTADMSLDSIYEKFNTGLPDDFIGHSLSMSDIIVLDTDDGMKAHYVDRFGFKEVPEFLLEKTVEIDNSEQLPKQQQILDFEINSDETIREKNLEALNSIEIGDEITLKGETFVVKSINGSFMMSMDNVKALSGEFIGEASRQFIGNWQNQLADEAGNSLIGISKPDISNTLNNEVQLEETVDNSHSWDVRVSRALNVIDGISTHISESSKKNEHSYVYGTYQSYEEASRALATLRKEIENNAEFSTELYAKCPYFERDIAPKMEITLDGERYSVLDFDRLANTVDLIKSDDMDVSMPYIMMKANPDLSIRTEKYDYIDSLINEQSAVIKKESNLENNFNSELTEGEQLAMFDMIDKPYQVITYSHDVGADDKLEYSTLSEAIQAGEKYLVDGEEQYAVFNKETKVIEKATDMFPLEDVFSENVLKINGINTDRFGVPLFADEQAESEVSQELTELEKFFSEADICTLVTHGILAHDEVESLSYPLFEPGYSEKHNASEKSIYGNGLREPQLYDLVYRMKNGEDISTELAKGLLGKQTENHFSFEGETVDFVMEHNDNTLTATCGNVKREVSYEEIGHYFLDIIENEYKDIAAYRAMEDAFDKLRDNHEFTDKQLQFINRIENALSINGYNNVSESILDVLNAPAFKNTYGSIDNMDKLMDNKLHDIISEINAYVSGEEITRENSAEEQNNEEKQTRFRITDEHIGEGGKKEKFRNNVEAIKTLQLLEKEERLPTAEEQEKLSKYIGWGGLQEAFDDREPSWNAEYYELKNLLTEDEYEAARATVKDAFFTSPVIINAIYETLANMGFEGGEILEPSMGVGNFFGAMPDNIRDNSNLSGVELDSISGRIAKKLYPEADIAINGFEKVKFNKGTFDLAIGNVPFGNYSLNDKSNKDYKSLMIHDYFFAKSVDSVRPGGIVAFVTSTGTLDKEDTKVRQMLAQKAELLGAIRLPDNAFQKNAGTQTATDIIFLKKRDKELKISDMPMDKSCDWIYTKESTDGFTINSYFVDNPDMILGTLAKGNFDKTTCKANSGADLKEQLSEAIKNIKGEYTPLEFQPELDEKATDEYLNATPDIENLTYTVINDKLYYRVDDDLIPLKESEQHGKTAERRKAMCDLAVSVRELLQAQVENRSDDEIKKLQDELNKKYDKFVIKYDRINPIEVPNANTKSGISRKAPNSNAFKNDVRLPLLQSLEKMSEGQFIGKTEIFSERTIRPHKAVDHVETSHEALILSVSEKGKIDFEYMEKLTGFEKEKIISDLKGDIYPVPELSDENNTVYQTSDEYLSGNIYKKIALAEAKIAENPIYAANVAALKEVIPPPLKATEIEMQLGMTWLDTKLIQQFMYETFETPQRFREYGEEIPQTNPSAITVNYSAAGKGSWKIENARLDQGVKSTKAFGTKDFTAYEILEKILNGKPITVTDTIKDENGKKRTIILEKPTKAAEDKAKQINAAFKQWIFNDVERRNELVKTYNEKFNCIRPREYDGSSLNFYGSNPEITLQPHQKNAVAHALFGENTLFAHQVGAGKTFEMIATAMEGKRLGLHNKSMFVVPNHLTEQIGSDFMKLYPNANILVAKSDDFTPQKRRQMCARIATGNFDAVIIGHSQLIKIPLSTKREQDFIKNQINEIASSLEAAKEADGASFTVKQLEATKAKLRERLDKLVNSTVKDGAVTFEELGIDKLFVDEAHEFKNLYVATKMENVSGLATNADVQKTQDLFMKCQYLDEKTNHKGVVFSTGTPVTNALSEMFTTMKYLQSKLLKEVGLDNFDSWAGNFTKKSTEAEISPSGSDWRMKTRLKFTNVPELVTMFKECADIKMSDQLNLDVPECEKNIVSVEPTQIQKEVVKKLGERAEAIHLGTVSRSEDNMLVVTGDGRKLGLDQRLYNLALPDEPQSKVNTCIQNVYDIWKDTAENKSTQLVFCDLGVPQSKEDIKKNGVRFDVYADIKKKLIEKGIPEKEIAFIHEASSETEKARLFSKVRSGDVRVLIGSTQKMGAGTNVQKKLIALHDLDCPWRPADLTQRLGRMVRQGNENKKVHAFRYVTRGTFDAYLYQMVEKKQKCISQIFTSKNISRTYDDIDDSAVDYSMAKRAAIDDERVREQMELKDEIARLTILKNIHIENKYELENNIRILPEKIQNAEKVITGITADSKSVKEFVPEKDIDGKDKFAMKIGNTMFSDRKEAGAAFLKAMQQSVIGNPKESVDIAEYKGFKIAVSFDGFSNSFKGHLKGNCTYTFDLSSSESGNMTRIDNVIASVPLRIDRACDDLERLKRELSDSCEQVKVPFEYESELSEKQKRFEQLTDEINADKLKGNIAPEQPESTQNEVSEKSQPTPDKDVPDNLPKSQSEKPIQTENNQPEQTEQNAPSNLNIRWVQNGKKFRITYDCNAENKVTAFADNKEIGHCTPEQLVISEAKGNLPEHITKCIEPLNVAFSNNTSSYIESFVEKVKNAHQINNSRSNPLFNRDRIMTDEFKPKSEKNQDKPPEHGIGG